MSTRYYIDLTELEEKILNYDIENIQIWLELLIDNKLDQCESVIVNDLTDKQASKLTRIQKTELIDQMGVIENPIMVLGLFDDVEIVRTGALDI
jgi:hypothetical protein